MSAPRGAAGAAARWFAAEHLRLPRRFAIKVLQAEPDDVDARARFRREAEVIAAVAHPRIVEVFDHDVDDTGVPFMVMRLLVGETLRERLRRGPLAPADVVALVAQTAAASTRPRGGRRPPRPQAEQPVLAAGDPIDVTVLDFGVSKLLDQRDRTAEGHAPRHPGLRRARAGHRGRHRPRRRCLRARRDRLRGLTGCRAFDAPTRDATLYRICHADPAPLTAWPADRPGRARGPRQGSGTADRLGGWIRGSFADAVARPKPCRRGIVMRLLAVASPASRRRRIVLGMAAAGLAFRGCACCMGHAPRHLDNGTRIDIGAIQDRDPHRYRYRRNQDRDGHQHRYQAPGNGSASPPARPSRTGTGTGTGTGSSSSGKSTCTCHRKRPAGSASSIATGIARSGIGTRDRQPISALDNGIRIDSSIGGSIDIGSRGGGTARGAHRAARARAAQRACHPSTASRVGANRRLADGNHRLVVSAAAARPSRARSTARRWATSCASCCRGRRTNPRSRSLLRALTWRPRIHNVIDRYAAGQSAAAARRARARSGMEKAPRPASVVGGHTGCDIVLADPAVSARHLSVAPTAHGVRLEDLGSPTGRSSTAAAGARDGAARRDAACRRDGDPADPAEHGHD